MERPVRLAEQDLWAVQHDRRLLGEFPLLTEVSQPLFLCTPAAHTVSNHALSHGHRKLLLKCATAGSLNAKICEPYLRSTAGPSSQPKVKISTPCAVPLALMEPWNVPTMNRFGVSMSLAGSPRRSSVDTRIQLLTDGNRHLPGVLVHALQHLGLYAVLDALYLLPYFGDCHIMENKRGTPQAAECPD